ncbi:hypothetical protein ACH5RR_003043 [Cinchona calisaya]|uniref:Uncharacterized protein n=1 Tax=Cinchona calisaya TaxID=153742 RepID=A0ABD3AUC6_9GENT
MGRGGETGRVRSWRALDLIREKARREKDTQEMEEKRMEERKEGGDVEGSRSKLLKKKKGRGGISDWLGKWQEMKQDVKGWERRKEAERRGGRVRGGKG